MRIDASKLFDAVVFRRALGSESSARAVADKRILSVAEVQAP